MQLGEAACELAVVRSAAPRVALAGVVQEGEEAQLRTHVGIARRGVSIDVREHVAHVIDDLALPYFTLRSRGARSRATG